MGLRTAHGAGTGAFIRVKKVHGMAYYKRAVIWDRGAVQNRDHSPKPRTLGAQNAATFSRGVPGLGQFVLALGPGSDFGSHRANSFVASVSPRSWVVKIQVVACFSFQLKLPQMARLMNPFSSSSRNDLVAVSLAM